MQIIAGCQSGLQKERITVRDLSRLIGMMLATMLAGLPAPLHYRQLQELKIRHLKETQSFKATVSLTEEWKIELQ